MAKLSLYIFFIVLEISKTRVYVDILTNASFTIDRQWLRQVLHESGYVQVRQPCPSTSLI